MRPEDKFRYCGDCEIDGPPSLRRTRRADRLGGHDRLIQ